MLEKCRFCVLLVLIGSLFACVENKTDKQNVSVSILPQKFVIDYLTNEQLPVNVMIPKGSSPATYSPTPRQIQLLENSKVYIKIGHIGFEQSWTDRIMEIFPSIQIYDSSLGIELISEEDFHHGDHVHKGGIDPHIWTSPKTMKTVVENTKGILIKEFPELKEQIEENAYKLSNEIARLDSLYFNDMANLERKSFYIYHPAYTYLARDYGIEQISIETEGKEPSVKWIQSIVEKAKKENIKAIFIQEEFDRKNAELIAKEINIDIVQVNPLAYNWLEEMEGTLNKFKETLN